MEMIGVIEFGVGLAILTGWTRVGAYIASGWLLAVAANVVLAGYYDVAARDVVMSIGAFTLARLAEVHEEVPIRRANSVPNSIIEQPRQRVTA
jgi:hypothetical protein